jgi:signal recognition particle subunit SRP54
LSQAAAQSQGQFGGREVKRQIALINSMTAVERRRPEVIDGSRKRRIANGSGLQVQDVNRLLKQFLQMQKVMKQFSKGGVRGLMRSLGGRFPGGFGG